MDQALKRDSIDKDLAELLAFRASYRHEHTDYDEHFSGELFDDLRGWGYSTPEAAEEMRRLARVDRRDDPIPTTWPEYLQEYGFTSPTAQALAATLSDPQKSHPTWFKEAEIAVRRAGLPLDSLTDEKIRDAIETWRDHRFGEQKN